MPVCANKVRIGLDGADQGHSAASQAVSMCMACLEHARPPPTFFFASTKPIFKTECATDNLWPKSDDIKWCHQWSNC